MIEIISEVSKDDLVEHLYNLDLTDKKLYQEINKSTYSVFQFSGNLASKQVEEVKPENFDELVAINSLSRPGASSSLSEYIENKFGDKAKYPKIVDDLLKESRGIILFQESCMRIFNKIGGFSLEETDNIRGLMKRLSKANKKKSDLDKWDEQIALFTKGAIKNGLTEKDAKRVTEDILKFSGYAFNKSHAYAYSYIAAQTLYLISYFKKYFYAAMLSYDSTKKDVIKNSIKNSEKAGFITYPPDINKSGSRIEPTEDGLIFGFENIKGVSGTSIGAIIEKRPYTSVADFILKHVGNRNINKRVTSALILSGAFDKIINSERKFYNTIATTYYETKKTTKVAELLEEHWKKIESSLNVSDYKTSNDDFIKYETELLEFCFHSVFSPELKQRFMKQTITESFQKLIISQRKIGLVPVFCNTCREHTQKNGRPMLFVDIEDMNGEKISIPIFASYFEILRDNFKGAQKFYWLLLYVEEGNIKFGAEKWTTEKQKEKMLRVIEVA